MKNSFTSFTILLLALISCDSSGPTYPTAIDGQRVYDEAEVLSEDTEQTLEDLCHELEGQDSIQMAIVLIDTLGGEELETYSQTLAESWGIGQQGQDNGLLLLVAKQERKIRIEVGYGLEGDLTDLEAGQIIDDTMTPYFRDDDPDHGVLEGARNIIAEVRGQTYDGAGQENGHMPPWLLIVLIVFLIIAILAVLAVAGGFGGGGYYSSGGYYGESSSGSSGGGFGGGGFGGGGSSGGW